MIPSHKLAYKYNEGIRVPPALNLIPCNKQANMGQISEFLFDSSQIGQIKISETVFVGFFLKNRSVCREDFRVLANVLTYD